jgi:RNA recognition motif-containing protein
MSQDYRPRNGGGNRRGGRRRRSGDRSDRPRQSRPPTQEKGIIERLFGWLFKKEPQQAPVNRVSRHPSEASLRPERPERPKPERSPFNADDIVTPKLYVGNLSYDASESDLFDLFSQVGAVKNVEVVMDRHSNRSKGFGFVEMEALDSARAAGSKFHGTDFMGRQIVVSGAKAERRDRSPANSTGEESV